MKLLLALSSLLFVLLAVLLDGCSSSQGLTNVQKKVGTTEVINVPGSNFEFIARTSNNAVYFCRSTGATEEAGCAMLFGGRE